MTGKKPITNRKIVMTAVIGIVLILAMVSANTLWTSKKANDATDEAVSAVSTFYLEAMADRRAKIITNQINEDFAEMEKAVDFIRDEDIDSQKDLQDTIGRLESLLSLKRFALVDENNIVYTHYTTYTGKSRHAFLAGKKLDGRTISAVSLYGSSKQLCLAAPTPKLTILGKSFKACFVQLDMKDLVDLMAFDDQGRTYYAMYSKGGGNLSGTELGPIISDQNLFDAIVGLVPDKVWKETVKNFEEEKAGTITFDSGKTDETLCYVPIQGTGWEMAVLIRESVIQDRIRSVSQKHLVNSRNQILFTFLVVLILAGILLQLLRRQSAERLEEEKQASKTFQAMANKDSLTGVRNKFAYSENEAAIDQKIQNKEQQQLAVVVGDINGLKLVNDTQGHAAGDQLIKDACALICEYFSHGAVFRIGGDEFAVILQGKGYDTMEEVVDAFNEKVEANRKENEVVVSIGYSTLQPDDQHLGEVFERADKMMYERKKELKEMDHEK